MASSTELARIEPGGYLALTESPAEIEAIITENLGGQEIGEFDGLPRIKVPAAGGRMWEVPTLGGVEAAEEIEGIVIAFKLTRALWDDDEDNALPICRSDNGIIGIGDPGGECKTCPMAQFGTATDDQGQPSAGQACNAKEVWFMLRPGSYLPVVVALPATSLKAAKRYRVGALGSSGMRMTQVVTAIGLEPDKNAKGKAYSKAVPRVAGLLSPEEAEAARAYADKLRPMFDAAVAAINTEDTGGGVPPTGTRPAPAAAGEPDEPGDAQVVDEPEAKAA